MVEEAVAAGLGVVVAEDLEVAVVVAALEEEEAVEDVDSEVCSFFSSLQQMCTCLCLRVNVLFFYLQVEDDLEAIVCIILLSAAKKRPHFLTGGLWASWYGLFQDIEF